MSVRDRLSSNASANHHADGVDENLITRAVSLAGSFKNICDQKFNY